MESRNPDNEMPDGRPLSRRIEEEGTDPSVEQTETAKGASEISKEEKEAMKTASPDLESLMGELGRYNVKSVEDIKAIRKIIAEYEGNLIYKE